MDKSFLIYFMLNNELFVRRFAKQVPSIGDELRFGKKGSEKTYIVDKKIWVYNGSKSLFERINIEISQPKETSD